MTDAIRQVRFMYDQGVTDIEILHAALGHSKDTLEIILKAFEMADNKAVIPAVVNDAIPCGEGKTASDIYKENHQRVASRLVNIALYETENVAAAVKAGVYINEEVTGRNDAKAKKQQTNLLLDIGSAMLTLKKAADAVDNALNNGKEIKQLNNLSMVDV